MSTRDQHTGQIEADLATTRLPQMCKPVLLTLPGTPAHLMSTLSSPLALNLVLSYLLISPLGNQPRAIWGDVRLRTRLHRSLRGSRGDLAIVSRRILVVAT